MYGKNNSNNVCRFYLAGKCTFGDSCKNLHPKGGNQPQQQNMSNAELTKQHIISDMKNPPIWLLSGYGHEAGKENDFNGDYSPEEIRFEAYKSQNGNLPQYHAMVKGLLDQAKQNRQQMIAKVSNNSNTSAFGSSNNNSSFGMSAFNQSASQGSSFFPSNNFPSENSSSAFPQNSQTMQTQQQPSQMFGNSSFGNSSFGNSSFGNSSFGQSSAFQNSSPAGSVFGNQTSSNSISGGFLQAATSNPPPSSSSSFGVSQPSFGGTAFGTTSTFSTNTNTSSTSFPSTAFPSNPINPAPLTSSLFGSQSTATPTNTQIADPTPKKELSAKAVEAFTAPSFSFRKIPEDIPVAPYL